MVAYSERYDALCDIIDDLPSPPGDEDNRFQLGVATGSNTRSYKLDYYISTNKSRKGKEVERYGELSRLVYRDKLTYIAQVEQLRLSEKVSAVRCKLDGQVYAMKTIKKFTAIRAGSVSWKHDQR
jgi:hypothetical protein